MRRGKRKVNEHWYATFDNYNDNRMLIGRVIPAKVDFKTILVNDRYGN
jgi:hypothetical protein